MAPNAPCYATDPAWDDVKPLPQDDGGPNALATIAYSDEYREASEYLRAIMAANEYSERALTLTGHLIGLNPAHYTVWLYRAKILVELQSDIREELCWLNDISIRHIKTLTSTLNYQIWHHRQVLVERLAAQQAPSLGQEDEKSETSADIPPTALPPDDLIPTELSFLAEMLKYDAKNYHVWSYRQWMVTRFALWSLPSEIAEVERLLRHDVRNNSAWNHRWFVVFGREKGRNGAAKPWKSEEERLGVWEAELEFVKDAITMAPQNESSWNYLRGLLRKEKRPWSEAREFAEQFAMFRPASAGSQASSSKAKGKDQLADALEDEADDPSEAIRSSYALDLLADAYAEDKARLADADKALRLLAARYDPIRANYWNYRRKLLGFEAPAPSEAKA